MRMHASSRVTSVDAIRLLRRCWVAIAAERRRASQGLHSARLQTLHSQRPMVTDTPRATPLEAWVQRMLPGLRRRSAPPAAVRWCPPSFRLLTFMCGFIAGGFTFAIALTGTTLSARRALSVFPAPEKHRYLVATSTSCEDIAPPKPWLMRTGESASSSFAYDVVIFDYSANHTCKKYVKAGPGLSLYHRPRTFKWPAMHRFFTEDDTRGALSTYTHFLLTDDDVDFHGDSDGVARLFRTCDAGGFHICQPALSAKSSVNMDVTGFAPGLPEGAVGRATKFVEQMSPLFTREALMMLLPYFKGQTHAWGIDTLWSDLSHRIDRRIGVIDAVQIDHMRPSGVSGLYKRVGGLEKAQADQQAFKTKYGVRQEFFSMVEPGHAGEGDPVFLDRLGDGPR